MRVIVPPIKSQGIKTKLVPWIQALVPDVPGRWIEPFLGTGVVAFNSGFQSALLADTNPHVIRFYQQIQDGTIRPSRVRAYLEHEGEVLKHAGRNGYDHFTAVKDRFNQTNDPLDFLFLSRAGFNGMMRFNKKGQWNIPFCKNQSDSAVHTSPRSLIKFTMSAASSNQNGNFAQPISRKSSLKQRRATSSTATHRTQEGMWITTTDGRMKMRNACSLSCWPPPQGSFCQPGTTTTTVITQWSTGTGVASTS